jgi:uncharacterized phage-associated protein
MLDLVHQVQKTQPPSTFSKSIFISGYSSAISNALLAKTQKSSENNVNQLKCKKLIFPSQGKKLPLWLQPLPMHAPLQQYQSHPATIK